MTSLEMKNSKEEEGEENEFSIFRINITFIKERLVFISFAPVLKQQEN